MNRWTFVLVLGLTLASLTPLQASQPYGTYGECGYGTWGGGWYGGNSMYGHEGLIPHYALYPPVYYSLPVPRTYGYSPFAYPPTVMTPEVVEDKSETIINPHAPLTDDAEKPTAMRVTSNIRVIANPYAAESSVAALIQ